MRNIFIVMTLLMTGCGSVTPIPMGEWVFDYGEGCIVTVYQTKIDAEKNGKITEMCMIEGVSTWTYDHSSETAIRKNAKKACKCNASNVYVVSRMANGWVAATATMVAFTYN